MANCVYRFLEVFLGLFSNANDRIMPMSDAVSSEGPKTTGIQQKIPAESFLNVLHFKPFVAPVLTFLRPVGRH